MTYCLCTDERFFRFGVERQRGTFWIVEYSRAQEVETVAAVSFNLTFIFIYQWKDLENSRVPEGNLDLSGSDVYLLAYSCSIARVR